MMDLDTKETGYVLAVADGSRFYIPGAQHVEKSDELGEFVDDEEASIQAAKDGIKFISGMEGCPDGVYLDTEENRKVIHDFLLQPCAYINY